MIPWTDLAQSERALTVIAIGAATIVVLHFVLFELGSLYREACTLVGSWRRPLQPYQSEPATPPLDDGSRRQELNAVLQFPARRLQ